MDKGALFFPAGIASRMGWGFFIWNLYLDFLGSGLGFCFCNCKSFEKEKLRYTFCNIFLQN
jgi:hypothetical protein